MDRRVMKDPREGKEKPPDNTNKAKQKVRRKVKANARVEVDR